MPETQTHKRISDAVRSPIYKLNITDHPFHGPNNVDPDKKSHQPSDIQMPCNSFQPNYMHFSRSGSGNEGAIQNLTVRIEKNELKI